MNKLLYYNTGALSWFILRRDRIRISVWLISLSLLTFAVAMSFTELYPSDLERQAVAETMKNPAIAAMVGQGYGLDHYTNGAMMAHQMLLFTGIAVAIMSILFVARHTRADEEDGRIELIRSLPTGRLSNLTATISVIAGINVLLALLVGLGLYALGIESMDLYGSLLYGAALGVIGIFFAAITALFAQLSESSRGTIGLSFAILGIFYLIRAIGDAGDGMISWFSPLGWVLGAEVYVNNYWWPILLTITVALMIIILSFCLNGIRDLESGFIPAKPGRKYASRFLQSPLGLTFRLQRTGIITWMIAMVILGASYGSVLGDLDSFFEGNEMIQQLLVSKAGFTLMEQFIPMLMSIMAMISTIPALMFILKLKGEENKNRTEHLLGRAVSRIKLLGGYVVISLMISYVMLFLTAFGFWSAGIAVLEDGISFSMLHNAAAVYLPALWIMIGIAVLLVGFAPKLTGFTWLYLGYSFIVVYLGGLLQFPEWMSKLSPFGHIPQLPVEDITFVKLATLTFIAAMLTTIGFHSYKQRDIEG